MSPNTKREPHGLTHAKILLLLDALATWQEKGGRHETLGTSSHVVAPPYCRNLSWNDRTGLALAFHRDCGPLRSGVHFQTFQTQ
jgi:hypothetical protein